MTVKALISGLDRTLLDERSGKPLPGIVDMLQCLKSAGLTIAVASGKSSGAAQKVQRAGLTGLVDRAYDKGIVGTPKGTAEWVPRICNDLQVRSNEVLWLGDGKFDMIAAVNGRIPYFNAGW